MLLLFWSYTLIPLSQAMVISFTTPLFIFFGSIFFFKEKPTPMSLFGLILGFLITVIIIRPDSSFQFGTLIALLAAITHAIAGLMVKDLTKTESIFSIMTYMILFMTPITFIPAIFVWELPNDIQIWLSLVSLAVIGTLGNFCWTKAISISQMTNIMPFDFSKLIFARPGHLLGKRDKPRDFGTFLIEVFGKISDPFLLGKLKKFRNIQAEKVAELLIKATSEEFEDDDYVIEFDQIKKLT